MSLPRIGYLSLSKSLESPGDRRRFVAYARARGLAFEPARPDQRYDLVVLSEAVDLSVWCDYPHGKVVYDLIDSYLAIPRTNLRQWMRGPVWFLMRRHRRLRFDHWRSIQDMCRRSDAVVCTTEEQRGDIGRYCKNVHIILDIHSSVIRGVKQNYGSSQPFNLVWEGLPSNLPQLKQIGGVLREVSKRHPLVLNLVTDPDQARLLGGFGRVKSLDLAKKVFDAVRLHSWDEKTCAQVIPACDLAVIPIDLSDSLVTGKPENKLLLLWRLGMPVVTSATPAYKRAMKLAGMESLACRTEGEWVTALERMMDDESLRRETGLRGRTLAETHYSESQMLARWDSVFASLGFSFQGGNR